MKMGKRFENGRSIKVIKRFSLFCSNQLLNSNMEIRLLHLKDIGVFKDEVVFFPEKRGKQFGRNPYFNWSKRNG
jgi:hypothetical protein